MYRVFVTVRRVDVRLGHLHSHFDGILPFVRLDNAQVCADLVVRIYET